MTIQKSTPHWSHKNNKDLLNAITAAFGLITCSDGILSADEESRFLNEMKTSGLYEDLYSDTFVSGLHKIRDLMAEDSGKGKEYVTNQLKNIKNDNEAIEIVLQLAQVAVVANKTIKNCEEYMMKEICDILEVEADKYCLAETT